MYWLKTLKTPGINLMAGRRFGSGRRIGKLEITKDANGEYVWRFNRFDFAPEHSAAAAAAIELAAAAPIADSDDGIGCGVIVHAKMIAMVKRLNGRA